MIVYMTTPNTHTMESTIQLADPHDILFSRIAQRAIVTGATLPSGLVVPKEGMWIIEGQRIKRYPTHGVPAPKPVEQPN